MAYVAFEALYEAWNRSPVSVSVYAQRFPKPYWANTSSNNIIRELIETSDSAVRAEIEQLIDSLQIPAHHLFLKRIPARNEQNQ